MHAYLIIAHHHFNQLKLLLTLLDDERNDLFVHIDEKVKNKKSVRELCGAAVRKSRIIWVPGHRVTWGGYSQIDCELYLLKEARKVRRYQYYHLISGEDLPLKNQDEIHAFFDANYGNNFVNIGSEKYSKDAEERCRYYYLFQDVIGKSKPYEHFLMKAIRRLGLRLQSISRVDRIGKNFKGGRKLVHGSNWFSITDGLAEYVLDKEEWIYTAFHAGTCVDELFLQSLVMNSSWKHTLYISGYNNGCKGNMRFIHFENGLPHTWRIEEFGRLMESGCCFARKFDETIDEKIITRITEQILDGNPGGGGRKLNTRIVYVVISSEEDIYFEQALLSAWSCRYHNHDTDISVLCDDRTYEYITASYDPEYLKAVFDHITLVDVPAKLKPVERSRWIKTSVRNLIGGDFLFVDTDTIICGSLSEIEQIDADIAAAYDLNCPLKRHPGGEGFRKLAENTFDCMMGEDSEYYNSGVVYVKDTDAAHKFYQKWHYLWKQGLKRGVVRDQNAMYKAADELPIGELPGIYNCQVLGSIQHLADAKIVHFFNAKWNSNEMSPFFGRRMYEEIKRYRIITKETQDLTLRCKSSFVSPSVVISNDDVGIWFGSTFEKLRILYRDHKILYKLADLESRLVLRILNKFSRKNAGGGVKKDSVLIPLMYEVAA